MKIATKRVVVAATALLLTAGTLTACSSTSNGSGTAAKDNFKIGLLLPDIVTARYESADRPYFEAEVKRLAPNATVLYQNAASDASKQQQQAQAMIAQGVKVLVLDAFDGDAAQSIVTAAKAKKIPVIDYDRLVAGGQSDYYISFDNEKVGELQGQAFVDNLKANGVPTGTNILMIDGSPTDNNATLFAQGAHKIIDASGYKPLDEYKTPGWEPAKAQTWVTSQITKYGSQIKGIYAANDGTAGGAIAALKAKKIDPSKLSITGQDASLAGIQSILAGDQFMTIYKAFKPEADQAADLAVKLAKGQKPTAPTTVSGVPSFLLVPVAVTVKNIEDTVVKDKLYTVAEICTTAYAAACTANGVQ
ncbi:MAG: transporter substrate-binding protein [Glaciihabitans sp.]|jgi:D-xylose transport system substrate-binding protein|nr:transporter substrate-binding protein [Glaciihabitans sp.]MDQ1570008.1 D-xylose transport system substrate-binding protein [Actinomycetota bacterium]